MASGWGCQYLSKNDKENEWCMLLKHKCDPGQKGCVLYNSGVFSEKNLTIEEDRRPKNRSDNPLGKK